MQSDAQLLPTPPDGGWGWVVVFGSFMIHVIADGVAYSFGIFYIEFLDYFKESRGVTGWVGSLMVGITWGSGPLASALTNRFGCRAVTIAGSFLSAFGFIISIWAPNIWFLYFSFGIIGGIGLGLIYLPAIVSVTYYFEKRRSFATGLAVCGSGVGTFVFAPLTTYLIEEYTWKGAILILTGLLLNCILCGALFRPLEIKKAPVPGKIGAATAADDRKKLLNGISSNGPMNGSLPRIKIYDMDVQPDLGAPTSNGKAPLTLPRLSISGQGTCQSMQEINDHTDMETDPGPLITNGKASLALPRLSISGQGGCQSMQAINDNTEMDTALRSYASDQLIHRVKQSDSHESHSHGQHRMMPPMARKDIFYGRSLQTIPMYLSNPALYTQSIVSIHKEIPQDDEQKKCQICSDDMKQGFREMMDFSLLKNPLFLMFAISNFLTSIGFCIPYMFLPDRAIIKNIHPHRAAFLISVIGVANTAGRVIFGWLSDRKFVNRLYLYNIALAICGTATSLSVLCETFELLCAYAAVFGMFLGVYVSLTSVVLVDLLGLECLTSSFGLTLLFQGIAGIIGPPIAGSLYDATGSYDIPFYIMGALIAVSGIMLFCIPCIQRSQEHRDTVTQHDIDMGKRVADETYVSSTLHINAV